MHKHFCARPTRRRRRCRRVVVVAASAAATQLQIFGNFVFCSHRERERENGQEKREKERQAEPSAARTMIGCRSHLAAVAFAARQRGHGACGMRHAACLLGCLNGRRIFGIRYAHLMHVLVCLLCQPQPVLLPMGAQQEGKGQLGAVCAVCLLQ